MIAPRFIRRDFLKSLALAGFDGLTLPAVGCGQMPPAGTTGFRCGRRPANT
jgi:hypothetical protein